MVNGLFAKARSWAQAIKRDVVALWLAARDPRTPIIAKALATLVAAYALSPIDLIPDFVPVLGYLDDLVLVPLGIMLAIRLIPDAVIAEMRLRAAEKIERPQSRWAALLIIIIWITAATAAGVWLYNAVGDRFA
ncbi:YkvA family protein [Pelagibacterium lentulum]|uniref:Membrane protein n=1 Tax=Pelagibacterium lentulum TaxID=2029865 RepID=A0A916R546_9HYPH|nr:YkvA family protein [Pelagibacterium lentulum]GGA34811.1 membrane protein [Pelagibacterium lentulum]